jgi:hypothetical protein
MLVYFTWVERWMLGRCYEQEGRIFEPLVFDIPRDTESLSAGWWADEAYRYPRPSVGGYAFVSW